MAAVNICSDFQIQKVKSLTVSIVFPPICPEVMEPDTMIVVFWMLSFKPTFSLSSFTFIKRLFSYSSLPAIRVVYFSLSSFKFIKGLFSSSSISVRRVMSTAYLRLLILLPAILIPACASWDPAFHMMYSAYKLNKQGDNIQPWSTPFLIWNQSIVPCPVLTVASSPAYRLLKRQVRWSGIPIFFQNFPQFIVIHIVKGFDIVNKAEIDVFLEHSCFFDDPVSHLYILFGEMSV